MSAMKPQALVASKVAVRGPVSKSKEVSNG